MIAPRLLGAVTGCIRSLPRTLRGAADRLRRRFGPAFCSRGAALLPAFLAAIALLPARPASAADTVVFAAASLQESLTAAADAYAATGKPRPVLSFAASSALARQIENGAPASLFVSADEQWMDYLASRDLLAAGTRTNFLGNELVLVAPASRPLRVSIAPGLALAAALGDGKLAMADPDAVPAGRYGKAALQALGVWEQVQGAVVRTSDVRAALALVQRDEARAAIVYRTDALVARQVATVGTFPAGSHAPIVYPLALLKDHDDAEARSFRDYLLSPAGKAVFARFGFTPR